ncbi:hypothetical protein ACFL6L_00235 [candidate division KSB1 bacterium]
MKRAILLLIALKIFGLSLSAQENVEVFGYFESQMMGAEIDNNFLQLFTNKLRIDLQSDLADNITFGANFDYITYHGKTEWNILEFLSPDITGTIQPNMAGFYVMPFSDRNFLDNAYIRLSFKYGDLTAGKQQVSLGTGYVWNPLDVFNIKDVLDPSYEQPGHNALRFDMPIGTRYSISALYSPEDNWRNSARLLRFKGRISRFDYSLVAVEKIWRFHDYTQFDLGSMWFVEQPEKRQLFGASTAGELFGLGVWAEYGHNTMEHSDDFYELVAGADYTFDFQTYCMVEFYRNTLGKTEYTDYTITDWMRQFAAEQKSITRDQFYFFAQHPVSDFVTLGTSGIVSVSDNSFALVPTVNYSYSDNAEILAYFNINFGKDGTAYGKNTGSGGLLRLRVYF